MPSRPRTGVSRGWAVHRSVTLLRVFLLASAVILVSGGLLLGSVLTTALRGQALDDTRASMTQYVDGVLRPELVRGDSMHISPHLPGQIKEQLRREKDIVSVKVWRPDGVLVWTNRATSRIGRRFSLEGELGETIGDNRAHASISSLDDEENAAEAVAVSSRRAFEVYAPVESEDGRRAIGAYEIYASPKHVEAFIASRKRVIWFAIFGVFAALYGALALLVRSASSTLRRQATTLQDRSRELMESYRRLEESSLEAIQSLNAAVDAKDPYTAGHSARVQQIALAVAVELGVPAQRLDAVRFGGLFHDIGKIAVPDSVLSKPGPLDADEFAIVKRHPADGAEILAHFGRLHEAVPLIRHHHERWDGTGYPDRLAGGDIPQEACVVGLADAWDAMTTDRPYRPALSVEQAAAEVRKCRGTQFAPAVVDAFFAVFRRRPALFEPAGDEYQIAASA
jgi:putative nucleotidyltransferase with HDIG domain